MLARVFFCCRHVLSQPLAWTPALLHIAKRRRFNLSELKKLLVSTCACCRVCPGQVHIVLTGGSHRCTDPEYFDFVVENLPKKDVSASWDRLGEGLHTKDKNQLFARLPDHVSVVSTFRRFLRRFGVATCLRYTIFLTARCSGRCAIM